MAKEPAIFLAAPAPDFFSKRLRLLFFFQAVPAPRSQKHPAPTGSGSPAQELDHKKHHFNKICVYDNSAAYNCKRMEFCFDRLINAIKMCVILFESQA